jgi:quinol monooxygenase YgiN
MTMAVRLVITLNATPGGGGELARMMRVRCAEVCMEPGCEQFEAFQSVDDPDKMVLLERWKDQDALAVHAELQATRPPASEGLMAGRGEREDYTYNRTR